MVTTLLLQDMKSCSLIVLDNACNFLYLLVIWYFISMLLCVHVANAIYKGYVGICILGTIYKLWTANAIWSIDVDHRQLAHTRE